MLNTDQKLSEKVFADDIDQKLSKVFSPMNKSFSPIAAIIVAVAMLIGAVVVVGWRVNALEKTVEVLYSQLLQEKGVRFVPATTVATPAVSSTTDR